MMKASRLDRNEGNLGHRNAYSDQAFHFYLALLVVDNKDNSKK